jgi:thiamine phosphate synthase YjbQ (UPF0047 family)
MSWFQKNFTLPARSRGSYLITDHVLSEVPEIRDYKVGMLNLFVQHTSCALSLNENWDDDVRADMSDALDRIAPSDRKGNLYRHSAEGDDDMPVCSVHIHVPVILGILRSFGELDWFYSFSLYFHTICLFLYGQMLTLLGSYQICAHWRLREHSYFERSIGNGYMAGYLVPGIPD